VFFEDRSKKRGQGGEELGTGDSCHSVGKTNELKVEKIKEKKGGEAGKLSVTGRQLRPLSSVLYRIISKRLYMLAAQLLLREKSGT
jgi:hypothetical protein